MIARSLTGYSTSKKAELNLGSELKWQKVTAEYLQKYKDFCTYYFSFVRTGRLKVRVMYSQNVHRPIGLTDERREREYFLLYYQFIKHAFGMKYCNPNDLDRVFFSIMPDQIPDKEEKIERFRNFVCQIPHRKDMRARNVFIPRDQIVDVDSKRHVILQGLDIILGAMSAKLNFKLKEKPAGHARRGKRTIAKEKLYKHINSEIRSIYPGFNVGISTGRPNGQSDLWAHQYRHWRFIPRNFVYDRALGRNGRPR